MTRRARLALLSSLGLAALLAVTTPTLATAQDTPTAQAPTEGADAESDRAQSFRAMTGPATEDVPGGALLVGAYGLVWLFLLLLVLRIWSVSRGVGAEIERLENTLAENEAS